LPSMAAATMRSSHNNTISTIDNRHHMRGVTKGTNGPTKLTVVELRRSLVPAKWEDSVRVIGMSECKEAALSLAHAFAADDLSAYLVDSEDTTDVTAEDKWRLHVDLYVLASPVVCLFLLQMGCDVRSMRTLREIARLLS